MRRKRDRSPYLLNFARQMRKDPTDAETRMWQVLRDRKMTGFKFRRQYPVSGYIVDFFCARCRLGIELDGGQHGDEPQRNYDEQREEKLRTLRIRILRFWDDDVLQNSDAVKDAMYEALMERQHAPSP